MAGAAGGALQTAQRIGGAIGTTVLATIFYHELTRTGHAYRLAVADMLLCAAGLMLLALGVPIVELPRRRRHRLGVPRQPRSGNPRETISRAMMPATGGSTARKIIR